MEDNKVIADFMSIKYDADDETFHTNEGWKGVDYLMYHTSWDWLIPVVSKCFKTGDDTHQWDNIMDAMFTCDINIVYAQVVEFINQYNNG